MQIHQVASKAILLFAALLALINFAVYAPPAFASDFEQGCKYYAARDYRSAKVSFEKVVSAFPKFAMGHYYLANVLLSSGQAAKAKVEYQNCLSCNPDAITAKRCQDVLAKLGNSSSSASSSASSASAGAAEVEAPAQTEAEIAAEAKKKAIMDKAEKEIRAFRAEWQRKLEAGELPGYSSGGQVWKPDGTVVWDYPNAVREMSDRDCEEHCKQIRYMAEQQCKFIK